MSPGQGNTFCYDSIANQQKGQESEQSYQSLGWTALGKIMT